MAGLRKPWLAVRFGLSQIESFDGVRCRDERDGSQKSVEGERQGAKGRPRVVARDGAADTQRMLK